MCDLRTGEVMVRRYRCPACRHCFRHYPEPEGIDGRCQSRRTVALLALLWAMGLSARAIALEVDISATTVWRDVLLLL